MKTFNHVLLFCFFLVWGQNLQAQWTIIDSTATQAVWLVGPGDGWAFGASFRHWDGNTWTTVLQDTAFKPKTCHFTSPSDGWVFGDVDSLYHFDGLAWSKQPSPNTSFSYCDFFDAAHGFAGSDFYPPYFYHNGLWTQPVINLPANLTWPYFFDLEMTGQHTAWMSVHEEDSGFPPWDTTYLYYFDNGLWVLDTTFSNTILWGLSFTDASHGWACGQSSFLYRWATTFRYDNGIWVRQDSISDNQITSIEMIDNNHGWAAGDMENMLYRYDGANWIPMNMLYPVVTQICFSDALNGWALWRNTSHPNLGGVTNYIFQTTTGGLGVEEAEQAGANGEITCYPNPCDQVCTLRFTGNESLQNGMLKVFDIFGRLIHQETIAENHSLTAGFTLSTSSWAAGIYYAIVETRAYRYETSLVVAR